MILPGMDVFGQEGARLIPDNLTMRKTGFLRRQTEMRPYPFR